MKIKSLVLCLISLFVLSCGSSNSETDDSGDSGDPADSDYRAAMREFVQDISAYAKEQDADFAVIPQNGHALLTEDGESDGTVDATYVAAIDGVGREDLFYGYDADNEATPASESQAMVEFMDVAVDNDLVVLATDYCSDEANMDDAYNQSLTHGYLSFAADSRVLDDIPAYPAAPRDENADDVLSLSDAQNYLINPEAFGDKQTFLDTLADTNFDVIIMDAFYEDALYTAAEVTALKTKNNTGSRLVIAYMSIGEAEDYRYYWEADWETSPPDWLDEENPDWAGNYKVRYWDPEWQAIIFGSDTAYLDKILAAGFDGVYLDIIDAYEWFEE